MRKFRPEEDALLIWNLPQARTAYLSGAELTALELWANGESSGFIDRLKKLGIIEDEDRLAVKEATSLAKGIHAPPNSFCAPESLHVELTGNCPLKCPQCYKGLGNPESIDINFLLSVIKQAEEMQVFQIALGGGEPLIYPDIFLVVAEIARCGMASSITTSGYGLDTHVLDELIWHGLNHIQISLTGSCEEVNARSRDGYGYAIGALELLKNSYISYGVNWVARRDNIDDLPKFIEAMKAYNVNNINILRYKPSANELYADNCLTAQNMDFLAKTIKNTSGVRLKTDSAFANLLCHLNQRTSFMSGCGAGRRFLALDAGGFYRPCSHVAMKEKSDSLNHIWYHSKHLAMFRSVGEKVGEPCKGCNYLSGCYGCRAVVLGEGGDFFGGDRGCIASLTPAIHTRQSTR